MEELKIGVSNQEYEDYSIENEINKDTVRNSVIRQADKMEYPMVCINCAVHNKINRFALDGLKCLIVSCSKKDTDERIVDDNGESDIVPVYINTSTGVLEVGRASLIKLSKYLCDFVKNCISDKVKVYYMESPDKKELMSRSDKSRIILDL